MGQYFTGEEGSWLWLALGMLALVLLGAMLATILTVKEQPGTGNFKQPLWPRLYQSFRIDIKKNPDFIPFLVSRLLILMAFAMLQRFALYFLMDVVGVADPAVGTADLLIVVGIAMLVSVYPAGRLSDRVGRRAIIVSSGLLGALGIVMLYFFHGYSYSFILFAGAILGIATGSFTSTNWALATDLLPKGEEARYLGLTNLATAGSAALTLFIIGPLIDFFNDLSPNLGYSVMLLTCFIYFIAGSLLVLKIKPRTQPK